jgi:hypothetical protein
VTRTHFAAALAWSCWLWLSAAPLRAQDLPPELTGDYNNLPPPQPAPKPTPPARTPQPTPPAPTRTQPLAPPRTPRPAPELEEAPIDPELGDVGPVADPNANPDTIAPELGEETPPESEPSEPVPELEPEPEPEADAATPPRAQHWSVGLGLGVGTLAFTRPASGGLQRLGTSPYAAMDIDVRGWLGAQNGLSWGLLARYQTSIGWALQHDNLFGLPETINTRTQALELSVAPTLRLGEKLHFALPLGAALRWFMPETHQYPLEPYTLGSLWVRVEAIVALTDVVTLRIGPEAHWILFVNRALEREGACCSGGAIGGQASLQARLGEVFSLAVDYRESRSLIPVAARFSAVERVVTARMVGEL